MKSLLMFLTCMTLASCATAMKREARAKSIQLSMGMTQAQVAAIFGKPDSAEGKSGGGGGFFSDFFSNPFEGESVIWKYHRIDAEFIFRPAGKGMALAEWKVD